MQVVLLILVGATWVGYDASRRDWSGHRFANATWKWVVGALVLSFIVVPLYVVERPTAPLK